VARGQSFWTAPASADATVGFLAIGDYGAGTAEQLLVRDAMLPYLDRVQGLLTLGDNAYSSGRPSEWQSYVFEVYEDLLTDLVFLPTWGNHDYSTADAAPALDSVFLYENAWRTQDRERYWSTDYGPLHLIGLDTEKPATEIRESETDDQLDWLEADLEAVDRPWTVAAWHKPAWSGMPGRGPDPTALLLFAPVLEAAGAQLVLQGHNHMYERFAPMRGSQSVPDGQEGTTYIVSGGGGRSLYGIGEVPYQLSVHEQHHFLFLEADRCTLTVTAIDLNGVVLDQTMMQECG
jgi:acid phosphatase type 7